MKLGPRPILFDVSHTYSSPFNTGVQRVVRQLAGHLRTWPDCSLVRFDSVLQAFVRLDEAETDVLIHGWKGVDETVTVQATSNTQTLKALTKKWLRAIGLLGPLARLKTAVTVHIMRPIRSELLAFFGRSPGVALSGCVYLTAEVFGERDRVRVLRRWFRGGDVRVCLVVHDLIPFRHPEWAIMKLKDFERYLSLFPFAHAISADSDHTLAQVSDWYRDHNHSLPQQLCRNYPGFDLPPSQIAPPQSLLGLGRFMACIGTVEPRKNQQRLLSALKAVWDSGAEFSFVFAGNETPTFPEFRQEWQALVDSGYPVRWLCPASEEEVLWLYTNAVATVYPSFCEGYGLPIVESLARGTPCIASEATSTGEVARAFGGCLLVDPENKSSMVSAMSRILGDFGLRDRLVGEIRHTSMPSWKHFSEALHSMVQRVRD